MEALATPRVLGQPVIDDGIRWLNFFNGRVLSAEDLRTDHDAIAEARRQLGRAIGDGVATGFTVEEDVLSSTPGGPILTVRSGLAINVDGQALELHRDIRVGLVRVDQPTGGDGSAFTRCDVVLPGTAGLGVYVLTVGPAEADAGKAPVAGLGNQAAGCDTAYSVEGVRFRLFPVPLEDGDLAEPNLLRNRIAYRMFGTRASDRSTLARDPFTAIPSPTTLLEELRAACFGGSDVPLAVLHWKPVDGLRFVDMWPVRRRPAGAGSDLMFPAGVRGALAAADEAVVLQFQDHLASIIRSGVAPSLIDATAHFEFLPPVGFVPIGAARSVDLSRFFGGIKTRGPFFIEGARVDPLIRGGLPTAPIDIASRELVWLYQVRQNDQAVIAGQVKQSFAMFTSGFVPYGANAQFDLAYWDFANYALKVT
jgi:hypothetical protein